jgi:hypothetical protein
LLCPRTAGPEKPGRPVPEAASRISVAQKNPQLRHGEVTPICVVLYNVAIIDPIGRAPIVEGVVSILRIAAAGTVALALLGASAAAQTAATSPPAWMRSAAPGAEWSQPTPGQSATAGAGNDTQPVATSPGAVSDLSPARPSSALVIAPVVGNSMDEVMTGHEMPAVLLPGSKTIDTAAEPQEEPTTKPSNSVAAAVADEHGVRALIATAPPKPANNSSDDRSWIAEVLALIAGAVAAGVVAWFLMRRTPKRNFG